MGWLREQLDKILLGDLEWKKKYCPALCSYIFASPEEKHKMYLQMCKNSNERMTEIIEKARRGIETPGVGVIFIDEQEKK